MVDLDNVFKLATPKYVYIRDAKLGILKYTFMFLIFWYVIVYQVLYMNAHLDPHHATGFGTMTLLQPTHKECDPLHEHCKSSYTSIRDLPYCKQYVAPPTTTAPETTTAEETTTASTKAARAKTTTSSAKAASAKGGSDGGDGGGGDGDGSNGHKQHKERLLKDEEADIGEFDSPQKTCRYFDGQRMTWSPPQPSEIFIPLRYMQVEQSISSDCYDPEIKGVKGQEGGRSKYKCNKPWVTDKVSEYYVANIEDFTLTLSHSFSASSIGLFGTSVDFQGFFSACSTNHPKDLKSECKRMLIPHTSGKVAPEDMKGLKHVKDVGIETLTGTPEGTDAISIGDLLKVTPVAQKYNISDGILDAKLPDHFGHPDESLREVGGMLLLDVNYDNTGIWRPGLPGLPGAVKPVTYTYRPYFLPMKENVKFQLIEDGDVPTKRVIDKWYGLTVRMEFNGKLVKFVMRKLLKAMTAGLVLLTAATSIVTALASYILPLKEKYSLLMYQLSEDFTDYKYLVHHKPSEGVTSRFATGQKLLDVLDKKTTLTDEDKLAILCCNEMRLNRLDGMDPSCVFPDGTENDPRNYCIGDFCRKFYLGEKMPETLLQDMSFRVQTPEKQAQMIKPAIRA